MAQASVGRTRHHTRMQALATLRAECHSSEVQGAKSVEDFGFRNSNILHVAAEVTACLGG